MAKGPNLTWIFIGAVVAVLVMITSMSSYGDFITENNGTLSNEFSSISGKLESESGDLTDVGSDASNKDKITEIWNTIVGGTIAIFVTGLAAIGEFFRLGTIVTALFNIGKEAIPGLNALFGAFITIGVFFIAMGIMKARRGTGEKA